ncbi:hypothetical protein FOB64_000726 [Candida albicans]|uniref:Uncharacterized protein n=1 Tax=Candida albicans TaxID=5476 RepID=A0A8H6F6P0_CANAX|nr:hypothetical protein FOB64_000726 [Candida albicans]
MISILSQNYSGDITIIPEYKMSDFVNLFENPDTEFMLDFICRGAKVSWPKVSIIHNHCSVEFALDKAITILRGRIITSANYRITSNSSGVRRSQSYYKPKQQIMNLVTSPVMNDSTQFNTAPATPLKQKQRPLGVQRHHSTSNTISNKHQPRSKRNSMSATDGGQAEAVAAAYSTVGALVQLTQGYVSGDSTLVNDDSENSNGPATTTRRGIRKARSSGNIRNNMDYNNADRPVSRSTIDRIPYKNNPYLQQRSKESLESFSKAEEGLSQRRNQIYQVLKDNNLSKQNNNSYYNLKQLGKGPNNQELINKLEQERKGILKNGNRESIANLELFANSDDDDLCKLELSHDSSLGDDEHSNEKEYTPGDDDDDDDDDSDEEDSQSHSDEEEEDYGEKANGSSLKVAFESVEMKTVQRVLLMILIRILVIDGGAALQFVYLFFCKTK